MISRELGVRPWAHDATANSTTTSNTAHSIGSGRCEPVRLVAKGQSMVDDALNGQLYSREGTLSHGLIEIDWCNNITLVRRISTNVLFIAGMRTLLALPDDETHRGLHLPDKRIDCLADRQIGSAVSCHRRRLGTRAASL